MAGWWPDADAAAGNGEAAPTQDELLDECVAEEIANELPSLDAGRRSLATPKAIAGVILNTCGECNKGGFFQSQ
eukprot:6636702-Karenia_brevis.AAC.1